MVCGRGGVAKGCVVEIGCITRRCVLGGHEVNA